MPQQEIKLELANYTVEEENGNGMIEPGEAVTFNLYLKNYAQLVSSNNVSFTLSTTDPDVTITSATATTNVPADAGFEIEEAFEFMVSEGTPTKEVTFLVEVTADIDITFGQEFQLKTIVAPTGILVWDGGWDEEDYSGSFITQFLLEQDLEVLYTDTYPHSFIGFDAVFLSFGNSGEDLDKGTYFEHAYTILIQEYLEEGGKLFMDGSPLFGVAGYFNYPNVNELFSLFGVDDLTANFTSSPINQLSGVDGSICEGIVFNSSNQQYNWYIDRIIPAAGATVPFTEANLGDVSVYNEGEYSQKTFFLSYSLAELVDETPHSSRYNLLVKVLDFLGLAGGEDYVVANFKTDITDALPGEDIQFTDWSVSDEGYEVESWAWDFDEDGVIDSEEQNPVWSYTTGGNYDIMLIASNGQSIDTLIRKDLIIIRSGIFVFEGEENGVDQSGTFIRNYLLDNGYEVVYANRMPAHLSGFDAVFTSFGSAYYTSPVLTYPISATLKTYAQQGGYLYLEGSQALGFDQEGNNLLWYVFGIENVENGSTNAIDQLQGQEGSIMSGMEFNASNQVDNSSIDIYHKYPSSTEVIVAFEESGYGPVAVQLDGTDFFNQKTFCMSYSLAQLEDGNYPNTRDELLWRFIYQFSKRIRMAYSGVF